MTSRDPYAVGERVLSALDSGRAKAHGIAQARAASLKTAIARLAADDVARGRPARGRAGRIARQLRGLASQRHVQRILDTLSNVSS